MDINEKLLKSTLNGDLNQIKECLAQGANVNFNNNEHYSPPIIAVAIKGHLEIAKLLIKYGANVNATSDYGDKYYSTALIESASKGHLEHLEIAKLLIEHGADVNAKNCNGWSPLMIASNRGYMNDQNKQSLAFCKFLIKNGANVNAKNEDGETALMIASAVGNIKVVKLLVENGAKLEIKNKKNKTAIDIAKGNGWHNIAHFLKSQKVKKISHDNEMRF